MGTLIASAASFLIGSLIARIATMVVFYVVGTAMVDFFLGEIFDALGTYSAVSILQLMGAGDAIAIIGSAMLLRVTLSGWKMAPGSSILGGGS